MVNELHEIYEVLKVPAFYMINEIQSTLMRSMRSTGSMRGLMKSYPNFGYLNFAFQVDENIKMILGQLYYV